MLELIHAASQQTWTILMLVVSGLALWKGGPPERIVAVANVVASLVSGLVQNRNNLVDPQWSLLAVDIVFLGLLLWLALRSDRYWPLFTAAFQLLSVVGHLAIMADPTVGGWAYITSGVIWSYLVLAALAVGTWNCWQRRRAALLAALPDRE